MFTYITHYIHNIRYYVCFWNHNIQIKQWSKQWTNQTRHLINQKSKTSFLWKWCINFFHNCIEKGTNKANPYKSYLNRIHRSCGFYFCFTYFSRLRHVKLFLRPNDLFYPNYFDFYEVQVKEKLCKHLRPR